jgi:glucosamine 6-phosphate synthetase-like amidotransferase/phosphosugar isomerase protein
LRANVHHYLVIPEADRSRSVLPTRSVLTLPAQLISYHMTARPGAGIGPDIPRKLSKTLTVD